MQTVVSRILLFVLTAASVSSAQSLPSTPGETLSGKPIVLANAIRGHAAILVAAFSREGGNGAGEWAKTLHADSAFSKTAIYEIAMIAGAPKFVRGMIKSGMRKGLSPADQDRFVVLTEDEQQWKTCFAVTKESEPYVLLIDAQGRTLWHGHGTAAALEPLVKADLP